MLNPKHGSSSTRQKQYGAALALGLGCDRDTPLTTVETAIAKALNSANLKLEQVVQLASIDKKQDEVALLALADKSPSSIVAI